VASNFKKIRHRLLRSAHLRDASARIRELHAKPASLDDWVDASLDFGAKGDAKIRTVQKRSEIAALAQAVADLKPRRILEIGTFRAGTLLIWSQLASELVVTCDLAVPKFRAPLYEKFPPPDSGCRVVALAGDSHSPDFRERVGREVGGEVDFLFIDGDHTEAGVEQDYEMYHDLVRPGGLIAFHDVLESQPIPENQVFHFWKRLRDRVDYDEFVDDPGQCGFGIGVVRVR